MRGYLDSARGTFRGPPATPVEHQERVDVLVFELRRLRSAEIVEPERLPAWVILFSQLLRGGLYPVAEYAGAEAVYIHIHLL